MKEKGVFPRHCGDKAKNKNRRDLRGIGAYVETRHHFRRDNGGTNHLTEAQKRHPFIENIRRLKRGE